MLGEMGRESSQGDNGTNTNEWLGVKQNIKQTTYILRGIILFNTSKVKTTH
jgi:hypothetical protein